MREKLNELEGTLRGMDMEEEAELLSDVVDLMDDQDRTIEELMASVKEPKEGVPIDESSVLNRIAPDLQYAAQHLGLDAPRIIGAMRHQRQEPIKNALEKVKAVDQRVQNTIRESK